MAWRLPPAARREKLVRRAGRFDCPKSGCRAAAAECHGDFQQGAAGRPGFGQWLRGGRHGTVAADVARPPQKRPPTAPILSLSIGDRSPPVAFFLPVAAAGPWPARPCTGGRAPRGRRPPAAHENVFRDNAFRRPRRVVEQARLLDFQL